MNNVKNNAQITVGMRNIKTAIAATLCALIYYIDIFIICQVLINYFSR